MILQLGAFFANLAGSALQGIQSTVIPAALNIGTQFAAGLATRELNRSAENARNDAIKAALRSAANAVSPTVAPGQGPQFTGGPPTGSGFAPATLIPPGPSPANQAFPINPEFLSPMPVPAPGALDRLRPMAPAIEAQPAVLGPALNLLLRGGAAVGRGLSRAIGPRAPIGRQLGGVAAGAIAAETAAGFALDAILNPSIAGAPGRRFDTLARAGSPLRITEVPMPNGSVVDPLVQGLPRVGRFQKGPDGMVQWFFFDGAQMHPVDRDQARKCVKKNCIFRFDSFKGKFVALGQRRMNPMNVRAFFRAGRRVDAAERVCRKMFSEKRKQKTGTVRRKTRRKAKR